MSRPAATASPSQRYRVSLSLYVILSLLTAVSATGSGLYLLYLARPFVSENFTRTEQVQASFVLFTGAALAAGFAALTGLVLGFAFASRIRGIIRKAEAISPPSAEAPGGRVLDELSALDAAVGRLTLSMDRFVRDSEILARLPEGMLLLGADGSLLSFNAAAEALLELPIERFSGKPLFSADGLLPLEMGNEPLAGRLERVTARDTPVGSSELPVTTVDGRRLLLEVTAQARDGGERPSFLVLLFRDASEKHRIREEIRRADQLAFLGEMAARVAHEIRTPLATIHGLVEFLQADLAAGDPRRAYIDRILQGLERQNQLVENLLTLSNPEPEMKEAVFLPELLTGVIGAFPDDRRLAPVPSRSAELPPVLGDPARLGDVFTNLIRNALEATPPGGTVGVRLEPASPDRVRVLVTNTGVGVPKELHERIFQPFFTTKPRGTGLGLAIARQIVAAHGGEIWVESDGESEATFVVELPAAPRVTGD